jgi:hypothetical protein
VGEEPLDSVLLQIPRAQGKDLPWWIEHLNKTWQDINSRLYDAGVKLRADKKGNGGGINPDGLVLLTSTRPRSS